MGTGVPIPFSAHCSPLPDLLSPHWPDTSCLPSPCLKTGWLWQLLCAGQFMPLRGGLVPPPGQGLFRGFNGLCSQDIPQYRGLTTSHVQDSCPPVGNSKRTLWCWTSPLGSSNRNVLPTAQGAVGQILVKSSVFAKEAALQSFNLSKKE